MLPQKHNSQSVKPNDSSHSKKKPLASPVRAINEDDDGYDPYTDWHDQRRQEPLFEKDPWR